MENTSFASKRYLLLIVANIFGIPVQFHGAVDASVVGAALLANIATGVVTWQDVSQQQEVAQATQQEATRQPSQHKAYESKFQRYRKLCSAILAEWQTHNTHCMLMRP